MRPRKFYALGIKINKRRINKNSMRGTCIISVFFLTICFVIATAPQAQAGFEWVPPAALPPASMQPSAQASAPRPLEPAPASQSAGAMMDQSFSGAMSALDTYLSPAPAAANTAVQINPYPAIDAAETDPFSKRFPVERALMESAGFLNPAPLGAGFTTGVKTLTPSVPRVAMPTPRAPEMNTPISIAPHPMAVESEVLTPLPGETPTKMAAYTPPKTQPSMPAPLPTAKAKPAPKTNAYPDAVGFGTDLPLALALSQVVPDDYALSFADNVDAGTLVSWKGGRPWNEVLEDMSRTAGLTARIQNKQIFITKQ